ncbi:MAG: protein O-GlcNAcase [Actinomycetota bacterium]|nr:protein O-GlcNAcase [Actinomycetota bacterium]
MTWAIRGLIEGFYGPPWSWDERLDVAASCRANGMTHYVYAPKDDPKHRAAWRDPYTAHELDGFRSLVDRSGLTIGFGISPGLDIEPARSSDRRALASKVDQALACGIGLVLLAFDDLPTAGVDPALRGRQHAELTIWLRDHLGDRAELALVPTEYVGAEPSRYLDELAAGVPEDVPIGWTGMTVLNDRITAAEATARATSLGGRQPLLWDNFPVNDAMMTDRLFLGPLRGRDPGLGEACSGYLANVMVQPRCSKLALASVAAYLCGKDPDAAWIIAAGDRRTFAEACDGSVPVVLAERFVAELDGPHWFETARPLSDWLIRAEACQASGLEGEADAWLSQVHREARLALSALRLVHALRCTASVDAAGQGRVVRPSADLAAVEAFGLSLRWPALRRSPHTVLGQRCGFRPMIDQWPDGSWRFRAEALEVDRNATDLIVRAAFAALAEQPSPEEAGGLVELHAGAQMVPVASDGTFTAEPGSPLDLRLGRQRTIVHPPAATLGV